MAQRLDRTSILYDHECCCAPKTSPGSNPFATYVKDIFSRSTKNTVTELWVNRVCQLILLVITTY